MSIIHKVQGTRKHEVHIQKQQKIYFKDVTFNWASYWAGTELN